MGSRFQQQPAELLRAAIREAGGNEVFAIGDMDGNFVSALTVTCRGQSDRVVALIDRPRAGQVVVHNHPSGNLTPSDADMQLAGRYGDAGVGVVIVDNEVTSSNWVVEPHKKKVRLLDPERVRAVFTDRIPRAIDGFEPRPQQIEMALAVTAALNDDRPLAVEAGTGTGKSLAYLVPAALWALENETKIVISTFTRTLQAQLLQSDSRVLNRAGVDAVVRLLQGRNNYLCKRRLDVLAEDEERDEDLVRTLQGWSATTADGSRLDLPVPVESAVWERILSDSDLTLRTRCPHYASCHYYAALREAAAAHVVIVNHALLLADLQVRAESNQGILPKYDRLILDEAHHLEDAATGVASRQLTVEAVRRAVAPLLDRPRRRGALGRIARTHLANGAKFPTERRDDLEQALITAEGRATGVVRSAEDALQSVAALLPEDGSPVRITPPVTETSDWKEWLAPTLRALSREIEEVVEDLEEITSLFEGVKLDDAEVEPMLAVKRARRKLTAHVDIARTWLTAGADVARWFQPATRRGDEDGAAIALAPIEVGPTLKEVLWSRLGGVVCTSATLTVAGSFTHWHVRVGVGSTATAVFPSPFDHFQQAILGLPRDLPDPSAPNWIEATARAVVDAVAVSDGGAFVLCTSYAAVDAYASALRQAGRKHVLAQGEGERTRLLERFMENRRAVLVGTDSFWEGVSVRGDGLRLVIIPRLPFRVPSDPLHEARREQMEARGVDPFRAYSLPEAVLKLRQGYGRLIRSQTDRGVVLLLDPRLHSRAYGRVLLQSLPPARRVKGPRTWVEDEMRRFFMTFSDIGNNDAR